MNIETIKEILLELEEKDNNKYFKIDTIISLLINDYFGGSICRIYADGVDHYFNLIENNIIDLSKNQFKCNIDYKKYQIVDRKEILIENVKIKYEILKNSVMKKLLEKVDEEVYNCKRCKKLVNKFTNDTTVFFGKDNNLVLVGEAPANNGWRKSHKLWRDITGKILPSGIVLQKLFDILNKDIFDITFIESVKCYPLERKNLKICSKNCKNIMLKQLEILNPKLIITLGEFPTRNLLDFKFNDFKDVVGKIYVVNGYKILPIYHPSPISPNSYKGNVPIFEKLKDLL